MLIAAGTAIVVVNGDGPLFDGLDELAANRLVPLVQVVVHRLSPSLRDSLYHHMMIVNMKSNQF
jgi:hypothetical protein